MLVQDIMTRQVVAIDPDMPIGDVSKLMEQRNIRHFPILDKAQLIGIVSDRDISKVGTTPSPEGLSLKSAVRDIMVSPVLTAHPLDPIEEAAKILRNYKIGAMPVMEDEDLVGIVTGIDFLEALVKMTGVYEASSHLEIELDNRPEDLANLINHIATHNIQVSSALTTRTEPGLLSFAIRVNTIDSRGLADKLRTEGFAVIWPTETY